MKIVAILAMDESRLIGKSNALPWNIPEDMKRFREFTTGGIVVMGRNTYFSLPEKVRPLPNRRNIVITREFIEWIECYASIESCIESLKQEQVWKVYLIGWASLYNQFFEKWLVDEVELTLVSGTHEWDIFVNEWRNNFVAVKSEDFAQGKFITYTKQ